jgi:hypothetical protein
MVTGGHRKLINRDVLPFFKLRPQHVGLGDVIESRGGEELYIVCFA